MVLGGAAVVGVPVVAAVLLRPGSGGQPAAEPSSAPARPAASVSSLPGFPAPPTGAVVYSRQMGPDALALAVVPRRGQVLLQASALDSQGQGASRLDVRFAVQGVVKTGTACGAGCYRATLATKGRPRAVEVDVRDGPAPTRWRVALPTVWPPRDASALVARAGRVWRSLRSLSFRERLASGPGQTITSTWRMQAPDRLAYQVQGGWAGVIVGDRRWDRPSSGGRWVPSAQTPVTQPVPFWVSVTDAHVLGTATAQGRPVWRVSFFDPGTPAWFSVALDRATLRTLELQMVTTAHFMSDVYGSFNTTPPIQPPR